MILAQITNSTIQGGYSTDPYYSLLGAFIGAFIGFFLFAVWDTVKDSKLNKAERRRVLSLLAIESAENIHRADQIKRTLLRESASVSKDRTSYLVAPTRLSSDGWTIAKAGNPLRHMDEKDLMKWILAYGKLVMVNDTLEARELSKATSRGMKIRNELIRKYDLDICKITDDFLHIVKEARDSLPDDVRIKSI